MAEIKKATNCCTSCKITLVDSKKLTLIGRVKYSDICAMVGSGYECGGWCIIPEFISSLLPYVLD